MAKQEGGFDCEFVKEPPEAVQNKCPVCLLVLKEPCQVDCCGYRYCQICIEGVRVENKRCPCCNAENFGCFEDKGLKRSLNDYQVYCTNKMLSCQWVGRLGEFEKHLNFDPPQDKQLEGCIFTKVLCLHCSEPFQRSSVADHQNNHCHKRRFVCEYCNDYHSTYEDVVTNHWPTCAHYPLRCPNKCITETIERRNLDSHVTSDCPLTIVDCDFKDIGCEVRLPRKDLSTHLTEGLVAHMSLQMKQLVDLKLENKELKQQMTTLEAENDKLKQKIETITQELQIPSCPIELTLTSFQQHKRDCDEWYSPPFYSHHRGYRMCLMVYAGGKGDCNTHVSVFLKLMKGEYDNHLCWPLRGKFIIQLVSQNGDERHHIRTISFYSTSTPCSRVVDGELSEGGLGFSKFIRHTELGLRYQENDCLKFRIKKVDSAGSWPFY